MKLTTGILIMGMAATAWGQNPDAIQNTRDTMHAVQLKKQLDSNAALAASQGATAKPASAPAPSQTTAGAHDPFATQKVAPGARAAVAARHTDTGDIGACAESSATSAHEKRDRC